MTRSDLKTYATIAWLTLAAGAVPVWAITQQYRAVTITASAEDDCPYYHGAWALSAVEPVDKGPFHRVRCIYK